MLVFYQGYKLLLFFYKKLKTLLEKDDDEFLFIVKKLSFFLQLNYIRFGGKEISQLFFNVNV